MCVNAFVFYFSFSVFVFCGVIETSKVQCICMCIFKLKLWTFRFLSKWVAVDNAFILISSSIYLLESRSESVIIEHRIWICDFGGELCCM